MENSEQRFFWPILIASIGIPVVVALLFFFPVFANNETSRDLSFLPMMNAIINGSTTVLLIGGLIAIKQKRIAVHRGLMTGALGLSVVFLISYLIYHSSTEPTSYGGEGFMATLYYTVLLSHILLAIAIVPLVLITFLRAYLWRIEEHRKIARITLPLWLYVTVTGVLVYLMIAPYY